MRYWILYEHVSPSGSVYVGITSQNINDNIRKSKLGNTNGNKSVLQLDLDGNIIRKYVSAVEAAKNIKTLHKFKFVYEKDYKEIIK